jgi:hypothetical protein
MRLVTCALVLGASLLACHPHTSFRSQLQGQLNIPGDPGGTFALPQITGLTGIDFNQNTDMRNLGITKDQVSAAIADSVQLQITDPSTQDIRFLDNLHLFATAASQEVEIAQRSGIARLNLPPPNPLPLDKTNAELKSYLAATSMGVVARGAGTAPLRDTQITVKIGLDIQVRSY